MILKFLSLQNERGDASIVLAMLMAVGVGTAVYYNMDKLNKTIKSNKIAAQKESAETRNISGLSQATALMRFTGASPRADDADSLPYIYPDPYLSGDNISATRDVPNVNTWAFTGMKLDIFSPGTELNSKSFDSYVTKGARPNLASKSTINFTKAVRNNPDKPYLITEYAAEVASASFDAQSLTSKARVPVPAPLDPICVLSSTGGEHRFQPNTPISLTLSVSGVAVSALIPTTTEALVAGPNSFLLHEPVDLLEKANSIRKINRGVATWSVTTPRPLTAVDGGSDVTFVAYAYMRTVNNNTDNGASCSFTFQVAAPATCKLWTDKASVDPGQCVNLTSAMVGNVQAGSLNLSAYDPTGQQVGGLTQNAAAGTGRFCVPATPTYATGVPVSKEDSATFDSLTKSLNIDQKKALYEVMKALQANLMELFPDASLLQNLSIQQFNELATPGPAEIAAIAQFDFTPYPALSLLSDPQKDAFRLLDDKPFKARSKMKDIDLKEIELLKSLSPGTLSALAAANSSLLQSYLGSALDAAAANSPVTADYKIEGVVKATDGTENTCLVHVTSGTNKCAFFGSQFPNYKQSQTVTYNTAGDQGSFSFDFYPTKPNWEVAGIATSPTNVKPCPAGARCYAIDRGNNRTPFVTVDSASASTCNATTNQRIELGCFEANTLIRMADGSDKPIRQLKENDLVYNPLRKQAVAIKRITPGPEKVPLWSIKTDDGRVLVTAKHPFLTRSGLKQADELQAGDKITGSSGERTVLSATQEQAAPLDYVWNFEFTTDSKDPLDHAILAEGVVTGDLYLQEHLARQKLNQLTQLKP